MAITITNQKPCLIKPEYSATISGDLDIDKLVLNNIVTPMFTGMTPGIPVTMTDGKHTITDKDIVSNIMASCSGVYNASATNFAKEVLTKTLTCYAPNPLTVNDTFAVQSAVKSKLPFPDAMNIYTAKDDVIPASTQLLAGACDYHFYFASMAFYTRIKALGIYFANEFEFDAFKTWLDNTLQMLINNGANIPADTIKLFNDFKTIKLDALTESLILRNDETENNEDFSFARMLLAYIMEYKVTSGKTEDLYGILPFSLMELYCPTTLILINVERHARALPKEINDEWSLIKKSMTNKPKVISNAALNKLTATQRNLQKMASVVAGTINAFNQPITSKAANMRFKKTAPTSIDIHKRIKYKFKNMATVVQSENTQKIQKLTYNRPSRRNPDSPDLKGKQTGIRFRPDIHVYLDCSGSISERNYQDAIKSLIKLAKTMNINLYFNSFSHRMSQCVILKTKDKTISQVYNEFVKIPKVSGGTDYEQIWHYINQSPKRKKELSLIITDMEYTAPTSYVKHPRWCYYVPVSNMDWGMMCDDAKRFAQSMMHIDPDIYKKILM